MSLFDLAMIALTFPDGVGNVAHLAVFPLSWRVDSLGVKIMHDSWRAMKMHIDLTTNS